MVRLRSFSSWLFTVAIRSSIVIVDAKQYGRADISWFNNFGVTPSFGVAVTDLDVVKGDDDLLQRLVLVERLVLGLLFALVCYVVLPCVFSAGYFDCF